MAAHFYHAATCNCGHCYAALEEREIEGLATPRGIRTAGTGSKSKSRGSAGPAPPWSYTHRCHRRPMSRITTSKGRAHPHSQTSTGGKRRPDGLVHSV